MAWTMVRKLASRVGENSFRLCHECGKKIEFDKPPYIMADARDGGWVFHPECGWKYQNRQLTLLKSIVAELKKFSNECRSQRRKKRKGGK